MQCIYLSHPDDDEYQAQLGITLKPHNIVYLFSVSIFTILILT
jgi:hypothetical protein